MNAAVDYGMLRRQLDSFVADGVVEAFPWEKAVLLEAWLEIFPFRFSKVAGATNCFQSDLAKTMVTEACLQGTREGEEVQQQQSESFCRLVLDHALVRHAV